MQNLLPETITGIVFYEESSFYVKYALKENFNLHFLAVFLLVSAKFLFWGEDWELGYNSMKI